MVRWSSGEPGSGREAVCLPEILTSPPAADSSAGCRNKPFPYSRLDAPAPPVDPPPVPPPARSGTAEPGVRSKVGECSARGPELPKLLPSLATPPFRGELTV